MGRGYEALGSATAFGGISLRATPHGEWAKHAAVAQTYGPAIRAFIIVPLVSGFFVDIRQWLFWLIQRFLNWLG